MDGRHIPNEDFEVENRRICPPAECFGKAVYESKAIAIDRIRRSRKRNGQRASGSGWTKGLVLTPYRCPHCHSWHVGATDKVGRHGQKRRMF